MYIQGCALAKGIHIGEKRDAGLKVYDKGMHELAHRSLPAAHICTGWKCSCWTSTDASASSVPVLIVHDPSIGSGGLWVFWSAPAGATKSALFCHNAILSESCE